MRLTLLLPFVFAVAGCGSRQAAVVGTVSVDGVPVATGLITFDPADGQGPNTGGAIRNGTYQLLGPAAPTPGRKIVRITAYRSVPRKRPGGARSGGEGLRSTPAEDRQQILPPEFNEQSTLIRDVETGTINELNFTLTSPKAPPH